MCTMPRITMNSITYRNQNRTPDTNNLPNLSIVEECEVVQPTPLPALMRNQPVEAVDQDQHSNQLGPLYQKHKNSSIFTNTQHPDLNQCTPPLNQTRQLPNVERMFVCCLIVTVEEKTFQGT
uniref:Uncharacterized protein n=1 Tax=Cacopsylla melanoneura TaxID=428564 RepID=A0A8D8UUF0_9HEMI